MINKSGLLYTEFQQYRLKQTQFLLEMIHRIILVKVGNIRIRNQSGSGNGGYEEWGGYWGKANGSHQGAHEAVIMTSIISFLNFCIVQTPT